MNKISEVVVNEIVVLNTHSNYYFGKVLKVTLEGVLLDLVNQDNNKYLGIQKFIPADEIIELY